MPSTKGGLAWDEGCDIMVQLMRWDGELACRVERDAGRESSKLKKKNPADERALQKGKNERKKKKRTEKNERN